MATISSPTSETPPESSHTIPSSGPSANDVDSLSVKSDPATLTPLRVHYLKKSLMQLQFHQELEVLTAIHPGVSNLSFLGPPFSPPPPSVSRFQAIDLPFLTYIFRQFILTFPFMAAAPKDFYSEKLQPFVDSVLSRNLDSTSALFDPDEDDSSPQQAKKKSTLSKMERNFSMLMGNATKILEQEEVIRLSQKDLDRLEVVLRKRKEKQAREQGVFEVNVVTVRTVVEKGRMRSRAHDEFIIRTRRPSVPDVYVARRYGDFRTLAAELRKAHPDEIIPSLPQKDRRALAMPPPIVQPSPPARAPTISNPPYAVRTPPRPVHRSATSLATNVSSATNSSDSLISANSGSKSQPWLLVREKNRLTLRAHLHSLMSSRELVGSPVLRSFLLSGPTVLTPMEQEDVRRREEADNIREDGRRRFAREVASRVDKLREAVRSVKGDIMGKEGLTRVFAIVKSVSNVRDLPPNYSAILEWARVSLASTVFHHYVASDNASESFAGLKRIHGQMPYFLLKNALKIANPIGMIRSVLDLFLAQPFGGRSLLQRMFTSSFTEEVKLLEEHIEAVKYKVEDPIICEKVRIFVYAPKEIQDWVKAEAAAESMNVLFVILRSGEAPSLNRIQMHRVARAHRAHIAYLRARAELDDSDSDDGPQNEDAWLFEDLKVLAQLYSRLRDREQLIELIYEGFTADLLKDIITIFYSPLAQVYRAASISDSLGDVQNFVNDLIRTVEQVDELSHVDPNRTVNMFIDLIARHEQSFYYFVHKVHSKGQNLFDGLIRWVELFITILREGIGFNKNGGAPPLSLEHLLPHSADGRVAILREVDAVALFHYKLKVAYEYKLRRRFGRVEHGLRNRNVDAEDEHTQALLDDIAGEISFGELARGDAFELAAEETDEESDDDEEGSTSQSGSDSEESEESDAPTTAVRSQTLPHPIDASHSQHERSKPSQSDGRPPRRLRSRSMVSLKSQRMVSSPLSQPPVPPLPQQTSEPQPLHPVEHLSGERVPSARSRSVPPPKKRRRNKEQSTLKPPDLEHIPKLLPLFKEMIRPHLRPRYR